MDKAVTLITLAVVLPVMACCSASACENSQNDKRPLSPYRTGPVWINKLVVVDLVELGYVPPDIARGMKFEREEYVGRYSLYINVQLADAIVQAVLVHSDRLEELRSSHPVVWSRLVCAVGELSLAIQALVEHGRYSGEQLSSLVRGLLFIIEKGGVR